MLRYIHFAFIVVVAATAALWMPTVSAYVPPQHIQRVGRFRPANFVHAAAPTNSVATPFVWLRMSSGEEGSEKKVSADGTFYDDEVSSHDADDGEWRNVHESQN